MRWGVALLSCKLLVACDDPLPQQSSGGVALPSLPLCDPARTWTQEGIDLELAIADRIADVRESGFSCGTAGTFDPAPPLRRSGRLVCAARLHSRDMAERAFVDHVDPDDIGPWDRLRAVEYPIATADEVIAAGPYDVEDVLDRAWLVRTGSCAAILADPYVHFGVGVHVDPQSEHERYFTLLLGKPQR